MKPTLYIVPTPIGNLSDMSPRAQSTLASVSFITCEDTRHTSKLLAHFQIKTPMVSLHEHNEKERSASLIQRILQSQPPTAAIVTDAGTPCISDPGSIFVQAAHSAGIEVVSLPGPSALTCALSASGFLQPRQIFSAFLPRSLPEQLNEFKKWQLVAPCIAVFYESPQRLESTLTNLDKHFGSKIEICVSREISKIHEEHMRGSAESIVQILRSRSHSAGECAICVNIPDAPEHNPLPKLTLDQAVEAAKTLLHEGFRAKDAAKKVAEENDLDAKSIYNRLHKG